MNHISKVVIVKVGDKGIVPTLITGNDTPLALVMVVLEHIEDK